MGRKEINNTDARIRELRGWQTALKNKFYRIPRLFDEDEWQRLLAAYVDAGYTANAADVERRIAGFKHILRSEHTPLTEADTHPWQLRADVK